MNLRVALRLFLGALCLMPSTWPVSAQSAATSVDRSNADLQFVVILSRHGVRSPLTSQDELDSYSAAPWPKWDVAPGIQTAHGDELIQILGGWDRAKLIDEGLLPPTGCGEAAHVTILADNDQRTRATGKDLADSIFPGCAIPVHSHSDDGTDPLFRTPESHVIHPDPSVESAAIRGRIGSNPNNLTEAYRSQLEVLDRVLSGCGHGPANPHRNSIFDSPANISAKSGALHGPVMEGGTLAENLLLEYTQGMSEADTGWGCLDGATLRTIMQLDTANWDYGRRTPAIARAHASNLLDHILRTMQQNVEGKPVAGAVGKPGDRLVILVGHDTNIVTVAGSLGINWILDGRVDDTPPGGELIFELWRSRADGKLSVRLFYRAQTLEQMRKAEPLSPANPPTEAPIFVPGCSQSDLSCTWDGFSAALHQAIDPAYVLAQP